MKSKTILYIFLGILLSIGGVISVLWIIYNEINLVEKEVIEQLRKDTIYVKNKFDNQKEYSSHGSNCFDISPLQTKIISFLKFTNDQIIYITDQNYEKNDYDAILFCTDSNIRYLNDLDKLKNERVKRFFLEKFIYNIECQSIIGLKNSYEPHYKSAMIFLDQHILKPFKFNSTFLKLCEKFRGKRYIFSRFLEVFKISEISEKTGEGNIFIHHKEGRIHGPYYSQRNEFNFIVFFDYEIFIYKFSREKNTEDKFEKHRNLCFFKDLYAILQINLHSDLEEETKVVKEEESFSKLVSNIRNEEAYEPELNVAGLKLSVIGVFERAGCINNHTPFKAQRHPLESKTGLRIPNEKSSQFSQICCLFKKIKHFF
ncbi:hypothetical protein CWI38_0574p0010 [Hamiltosporidium tvaerminnensis]|uniref:Uncharacterized protein n=1 Tax=Hamiltosporidium tvaerminnensis TaxID=1176355 RepID=A0A4Q9LYY8_9MICR|nr:hypothetical protein CWI38_0574p0010 [Hamiltosporidium tvaerminnensis]